MRSFRADISGEAVMNAAPVVIVGGGPVGQALGIDLATRSQACILVEERTGPPPQPKATLVGARRRCQRKWTYRLGRAKARACLATARRWPLSQQSGR